MTSLNIKGAERLIVALDLPSVDSALRAVERLDNVSFFKVGLQLFVAGGLPTLLQSIRKVLFSFPDETVVYSGHGEATTIGRERRTNPFLLP